METNCVKRRTGPKTHVTEPTAKTHGTYSNKTLRFWMMAMHTSKYLLSHGHLGMIPLILSITSEDTVRSLEFIATFQDWQQRPVWGVKIRLNHSPSVWVWNWCMPKCHLNVENHDNPSEFEAPILNQPWILPWVSSSSTFERDGHTSSHSQERLHGPTTQDLFPEFKVGSNGRTSN